MRYCVNATVTVDAWAYVEAETREDALELASNLREADFETGDALYVAIEGVERDG